MSNNPVSFIKVTTDIAVNFIGSAKKKIIFVKPSLTNEEIEALINAKGKLDISVEIYIESGDNAIRYGFGEKPAIEKLEKNIKLFDVNIAERIRIALLIVDDRALIYMPHLAFVEDESNVLSFPNGFLCNEEVTSDIISQLKLKENVNIEIGEMDNVVIFPPCRIKLGDKNDVTSNIKTTIEKLNNKPAIDPAKLKKVIFYRNNYKIVKMQIRGVRINKKTINLKPFYALLPEINERLKSSWTIFTKQDIDELQNTYLFDKELKRIIESEYSNILFDAGRFGLIIDAQEKGAFIDSINELKEDYKNYIGEETKAEVKNRFENNDTNTKKSNIPKTALNTAIKNSRKQLEEYLFGLCPPFDEFKDIMFKEYRSLKDNYNNNKDNKEKIMREFIRLFVSNKLKFTDVDEIIGAIDIVLDWYDISDELLFDNKDFKFFIKKYNLEFRKSSTGYEDMEK